MNARAIFRAFLSVSALLPAFFLVPNFAVAQPDLRVAADTSLLRDGVPGYRFETLDRQPRPDGPRYRIYLATPLKAPPPAGYPVLYLLDGNAALDALKTRTAALERLAASSAPPVLVMIGYDTPARFDVLARAHDYTPPVPGEPGLTDQPGSGRKAGGAEIFRHFIIDTLRPELRQKLRLDPQRQTLWGHSYGGLFVLHLLFTRPDDFQQYIAISPSLWWRDGWILREEKAFAARPLPRPITLLALAGSDEAAARTRQAAGKTLPESIRQRNALPQDSLQRLITRLNAKDGVSAKLVLLEGKTHGEMFALGLDAALRQQGAED